LRIEQINNEMRKIIKDHQEIINNINVFKDKLQHKDDNQNKGEGE